MGLLQERIAGINAKLCDQITPKISTSHPKALPNMHPINGRAQIMEQQNNLQIPWILHRQSQREKIAGSNKLLEHSSNMPAL